MEHSGKNQNNQSPEIRYSPGVPHISVPEMQGDSGFEFWRGVLSPVTEARTQRETSEFYMRGDYFNLNGLVFHHTKYGSLEMIRESKHIRNSENLGIAINFFVTGASKCHINGHDFVQDSSQVSLLDWGHTTHKRASHSENYGVAIPRHLLDSSDWVYEKQPCIAWNLETPQARILRTAFFELWRSLPSIRAEDASAVVECFVGMLNGLLDSTNKRGFAEETNHAMFLAMRRYLDERLDDPELSPDDLTKAFQCSRATVYRLFREIGGVRTYLRHQRLIRCYYELSQPNPAFKRVYEVAERWGFVRASYFNHAFKKKFGHSPSDVVANAKKTGSSDASAIDPSSEGPITVLHDWYCCQD